MGHDADALLRLRRAARRRLDCFRLCPLADWPRLDRDLCGRLGFGACRSPGQRLLPCFLSDRLSFSNRLSSCTRSLPKFLPLSRPMNPPARPKTGARQARERKAPEYLQAPPSPIKKGSAAGMSGPASMPEDEPIPDEVHNARAILATSEPHNLCPPVTYVTGDLAVSLVPFKRLF